MRIKSKLLCFLLITLLFIVAIFFHLDIWGTATSFSESTEHIIRTHRIPAATTVLITDGSIEYESHTLSGQELSAKALFLSGGVTEILTGLLSLAYVHIQKRIG